MCESVDVSEPENARNGRVCAINNARKTGKIEKKKPTPLAKSSSPILFLLSANHFLPFSRTNFSSSSKARRTKRSPSVVGTLRHPSTETSALERGVFYTRFTPEVGERDDERRGGVRDTPLRQCDDV